MHACRKMWLATTAFSSSFFWCFYGGGGRSFSSAEFTADTNSGHASRETTRFGHVDDTLPTCVRRPTIDTYRAMSVEELEGLLRTRERQVRQLRAVYEDFHYEADKRFRTMVFDYHDRAMQLSQVHGKMQLGSLQISREALVKMREQQEMFSRDHRIVVVLCTVFGLLFWVWVRRHYVSRAELDGNETGLRVPGSQRSVTGIGSYGENVFGSAKRSGRVLETSWERELRERQERKSLKEE